MIRKHCHNLGVSLKLGRLLSYSLLFTLAALSLAFLPVGAVSDFSLSAIPSSVKGPSLSSTVTIASQGGFSGDVNVSATVDPLGPSISLTSVVTRTSVILSLTSGGTASTPLFASSNVSGNFTITVVATGGSISHSIPVSFQATPPPADFTVDCCFSQGRGYMGRVAAGGNFTSWGWVTSVNHFSGNVNVTVTLNLNLSITIRPPTVSVPDAGTALPGILFHVPAATKPGTYAGTITATNGSITHTEQLTLTVDPPPLACPTCIQDSWSLMTVLSGIVLVSSVATGLVFPRMNKGPRIGWIVRNVVLVSSLASIGVIASFGSGLLLVSHGWLGLTCIQFWNYGFPFPWREILGCGTTSLELNWSAFSFDVAFFMAVGYLPIYAYNKIWKGRRSNLPMFPLAAGYVAVALTWFVLFK
jgi:hypothetical protein